MFSSVAVQIEGRKDAVLMWREELVFKLWLLPKAH